MWIIIIVVSTIFAISYRFYLSKSFAYNDEILHSKNYNNGKFVNSIPNPNFSFKKYAPFNISFMKIGAYDETWPYIQINPEEAIQIQREIKADVLVPTHWATFDLGLHSWYEPIERLIDASNSKGTKVLTPKVGEIVNLKQYENKYWWKEFK